MARIGLLPAGVRQSLLYASGLVLSKGLSLIMVPVVTGYLSPDQYGRLEVLITLADLGGLILGLGLADTLFRFAGAARDSAERTHAAAETLGLALWVALLGGVSAQLAAPWLLQVLPGTVDEMSLRLLLVTLTLTAAVQVPLAWLRLNERALQFFAMTTAKVVGQALLVWAALDAGYGVPSVIAAGTIAEVGLSVALVADQMRATGVRLVPDEPKRLLAYGLPLVVSGLAGFLLGSFDRWVLAGSVGEAEMARYALAARFALATALALQPFEMWWYARRIRILSEPNGLAASSRMAGLGMTLAILAAAGVSLAGPAAIRLLTPADYHAAADLVPWLAAIAALRTMAIMVSVGCYIRKTGTVPMLINLSAAAVALALYLLLIPQIGVGGAILALLMAQTLRILCFATIGARTAPIAYPTLRLVGLGVGLTVLTAVLAPVFSQTVPILALVLSPTIVVAGAAGALGLGLIPWPTARFNRVGMAKEA